MTTESVSLAVQRNEELIENPELMRIKFAAVPSISRWQHTIGRFVSPVRVSCPHRWRGCPVLF